MVRIFPIQEKEANILNLLNKMEFKIGKVKFSEKNCVIIAEAGVNHNGSLKIAEKLIKEAKLNGADIIKFQTYKANKLVIKKSPRFWKWKGETVFTCTRKILIHIRTKGNAKNLSERYQLYRVH